MTLKSPRPKPYPEVPKTLGEHLFKRRFELGLIRRQAALRLLVSPDTVLLWEHGRATPTVRYYPAILRFLGYDPFPEPKTLPERIARHRQRLGLSIEAAAKILGVDEGTFGRWESGEWKPRLSGKAVER
ncbi:MAG TPA: helix-turn-helix domain-containing protein, partial [Rhizomicrobium sp.]|nr:helix-turn-helix domain-containing protein [Rhizomicrobium sp.]